MDKRLRIYLAGPYSHFDVAANVRRAVCAGAQILAAGHVPFIPHLYHLACMIDSSATWRTLCLDWLDACQALVRLEGYSPGADREVERAKQLGMPVYYSVAACLAACPSPRKESHEQCR